MSVKGAKMKLTLQRYLFGSDYTMGLLFIDGVYFCDTIEDTFRGNDLNGKKVANETCIPYGVYTIKITYSAKYKKNMPQILNVPYFEGVRIHAGNKATDTSGCVIVGIKSQNGEVLQSRKMYNALLKRLETANNIKIDIC